MSASSPSKRINKAVKSTARPQTAAPDASSSSSKPSRRPNNSTDSMVSSSAFEHSEELSSPSSSTSSNGHGRHSMLATSSSDDMPMPSTSTSLCKNKRKISADSLSSEIDQSTSKRRESVDSIIELEEESSAPKDCRLSSTSNLGTPTKKVQDLLSTNNLSGFSKRLKGYESPPSQNSAPKTSTSSSKLESFLDDAKTIVDMFRTEKNAIDQDVKRKLNYALFERTSKSLLAPKTSQDPQSRIVNARTLRDLSKFKRLREMIDPSSSKAQRSAKETSLSRVAMDTCVQAGLKRAPSTSLSSATNLSIETKPDLSASPQHSRSMSRTASDQFSPRSSTSSSNDPAVTRLMQKYNYVYKPTLQSRVEEGDDGRKRLAIVWTVDRVDSWIRAKVPPPNDQTFCNNISHYELYVLAHRSEQQGEWIKIQDIRGGKPPDKCPLVGFDTGDPFRFKIRFIDHQGLESPFSNEITICS